MKVICFSLSSTYAQHCFNTLCFMIGRSWAFPVAPPISTENMSCAGEKKGWEGRHPDHSTKGLQRPS